MNVQQTKQGLFLSQLWGHGADEEGLAGKTVKVVGGSSLNVDRGAICTVVLVDAHEDIWVLPHDPADGIKAGCFGREDLELVED